MPIELHTHVIAEIIDWASPPSSEVVSDLSPQLGGDLDLNNFDIIGTGNINITGTIDATGVITGSSFSGNATSATSAAKWTTGRTITLTGDVTGVSAVWDGSGNISFATIGASLNGSNISTGTVPFARLPTGTGASQVAVGNHTHTNYVENTSDTITGILTMSNSGSTNHDIINFSGTTGSFHRGVAWAGKLGISCLNNDTWLRLNPVSEFTSGIYTPSHLRVDGNLLLNSADGLKAVADQANNWGNIEIISDGLSGYAGILMEGATYLSNGINSGMLWGDGAGGFEWAWFSAKNGESKIYHNGNPKLETATAGVVVTGSMIATGEVEAFDTSDIKLKSQIKDIDPREALKALKSWRTIRYWNKSKKKYDIGFIAQEVEKDFPEVVKEDEKGYKMIHYGKLDAVLAAAIKAL